ncbi:MAG: hypothetical protein KIT72_03315 [Polyangiaceae bacterium]|nr:hypothetical protein [Polyangiaceae bacterium]MCW5789430.1 hypothetical protein [Polyangiaceae bacterium]
MLAALLGLGGAFGCNRSPPPEPHPPAPSTSALPIGPSLLTEKPLADAMAKLREAVGGDVMALELRIYPARIVLQAQDPARPSNVDQYIYKEGEVSSPVPVKLQGTGKLEDNLFQLSEVSLDRIPPLAGRALTELRIEDAHVGFVSVKRDLPRSMSIRVRVKVSSPRKDAYLDTDLDGNPLDPDAGAP